MAIWNQIRTLIWPRTLTRTLIWSRTSIRTLTGLMTWHPTWTRTWHPTQTRTRTGIRTGQALLPALVIAIGLGLGGCCSRQPATEFNRFAGTANEPVGLCGIFSGFGTTEEPERWGAVYSPVTAEEYGALLCRGVEPAAYATCVNRVWARYRQAKGEDDPPPGTATAGPFAVVMAGNTLQGRYWSQPFAAGFRVSSTNLSCRGGYDAFAGDAQAIYQVRCSDGARGWAQVVRDRDGRDGIGGLYLDDGRVGQIVFGPDVLSDAAPPLRR